MYVCLLVPINLCSLLSRAILISPDVSLYLGAFSDVSSCRMSSNILQSPLPHAVHVMAPLTFPGSGRVRQDVGAGPILGLRVPAQRLPPSEEPAGGAGHAAARARRLHRAGAPLQRAAAVQLQDPRLVDVQKGETACPRLGAVGEGVRGVLLEGYLGEGGERGDRRSSSGDGPLRFSSYHWILYVSRLRDSALRRQFSFNTCSVHCGGVQWTIQCHQSVTNVSD